MHYATVDIANPKSDHLCRHAVLYNDYRSIRDAYAVESRIYLADRVKNSFGYDSFEKSTHWFTNIMVFDIDVDVNYLKTNDHSSENVPLSQWDLEQIQNNALNELENLLGKPKYVIKNANKYSKADQMKYLYKDGAVHLPKQFGCHVVYELNDTLSGDFPEMVNLYHKVRLAISEKVGADTNFRGHMYKNPENTRLFNVQKNCNYDHVDFVALAREMKVESDEKIDAILSLNRYETLTPQDHPELIKSQNELIRWYHALNEWKIPSINSSKKIKIKESTKHLQSESRNVSLFNWMKTVPSEDLVDMTLNDVHTLVPDLFDMCMQSAELSNAEFESIKRSVLAFRSRTGIEPIPAVDIDMQVLPIIDVKSNKQSVDHLINLLLHAEKILKKRPKIISLDINGQLVDVKMKDNNINLGNLLLVSGLSGLSAVNCMMKQDVIDHLLSHNLLTGLPTLKAPGLYDIKNSVKRAVYFAHFAIVYAIRNQRKQNIQKKAEERIKIALNRKNERNKLRIKYGVPVAAEIYAKNDNDLLPVAWSMLKYVKLLNKNGHLDQNGNPFAVSYYQSVFHVRNQDAVLFVKLIKMCIMLQRLVSNARMLHDKHLAVRTLANKKLIDLKSDFLNASGLDISFTIWFTFVDNIIIYAEQNRLYVKLHMITILYLYLINKIFNNNRSSLLFDRLSLALELALFVFYKKLINFKDIMKILGGNLMTSLVFDVETSDLDPRKSFVLSIGAVLYNHESGLSDEFYTLLNWTKVPFIKWKGTGAVEIHGITEEELKTSPDSRHPAQAIIDMCAWISAFMDKLQLHQSNQEINSEQKINRTVNYLVAHNSPFDCNMMRSNLQFLCKRYTDHNNPAFEADQSISLDDAGEADLNKMLALFTKGKGKALFIDTLMIDRIFHFEENGIKLTHNLEDIGNRMGLGANELAHNAMYDTKRLADMYKVYLEELNHKGIALDESFEERLARKWIRERDKYRKKEDIGYYGLEMGILEVETNAVH